MATVIKLITPLKDGNTRCTFYSKTSIGKNRFYENGGHWTKMVDD